MSSPFESLALRLTRRKGNHPLLWIVFGGGFSAALVFPIVTGESFLPVSRLIRAFGGMSSTRTLPITAQDEPVLFGIMIVVLASAAFFSLSVGVIAWRARAKRDF